MCLYNTWMLPKMWGKTVKLHTKRHSRKCHDSYTFAGKSNAWNCALLLFICENISFSQIFQPQFVFLTFDHLTHLYLPHITTLRWGEGVVQWDSDSILPSSVQVGKFSASLIGNWDWSYNRCETHPPHSLRNRPTHHIASATVPPTRASILEPLRKLKFGMQAKFTIIRWFTS